MYKSYQQKHNPKDEKLEEGLLGNLKNIFNGPGLNIGNKFQGNFMQSNMTGQPTNYPMYVQNPGVAIAKSNFNTRKKQLLQRREIFWDSDFTANQIELPDISRSIEWKRPFEFSRPQFFTQGASRFDINQGSLGDCWVLSAIASLCLFPSLFQKVVPVDQSFNEGDYCGMFHFNIWYYGQWIEVLVDDLLPTTNNQLVFIESTQNNEFWSALLEKAYAKVYGSYKNLRGGFTSEAMVDLSGGIVERIDIEDSGIRGNQQDTEKLFFQLMHAFNCFTMMSCSKTGGLEDRATSGLVTRHAYAVTGVCLVNTDGMGQARIIRLRNPWGNDVEWRGPWSDGSVEWSQVPPQELERLQLTSRSDGEFWMDFNDFINEFDRLELCYTQPQAMEDVDQMKSGNYLTNKSWEMKLFYGEWKVGLNAGGSNKRGSYWHNPQYTFHIPEPDPHSIDGTASVIIGLMQRNLRIVNKDLAYINYSIYQTDKPRDRILFPNEMAEATFIASSGPYSNVREVSGRHKLRPGFYIIIPSTDEDNTERQFLIRIFSVTKSQAQILDQKMEIDNMSRSNFPINEEYNTGRLNNLFRKHASSPGRLNFTGLQMAVMQDFHLDPKYGIFSLKTAQAAIFMLKNDYEESINETEFQTFWWYLLQWKNLFVKHDLNKDGNFSSMELRFALSNTGIRVNNFLLEKLVRIYGICDTITFDSYIRCCIQLKSIGDSYQSYCNLPVGNRKMSLEEFMDLSLDTMTD